MSDKKRELTEAELVSAAGGAGDEQGASDGGDRRGPDGQPRVTDADNSATDPNFGGQAIDL